MREARETEVEQRRPPARTARLARAFLTSRDPQADLVDVAAHHGPSHAVAGDVRMLRQQPLCGEICATMIGLAVDVMIPAREFEKRGDDVGAGGLSAARLALDGLEHRRPAFVSVLVRQGVLHLAKRRRGERTLRAQGSEPAFRLPLRLSIELTDTFLPFCLASAYFRPEVRLRVSVVRG